MIKCLLLEKGAAAKYGSSELVSEWQENQQSMLWIDLNNLDIEQETTLLTQFNCHPLVIADTQRERHPPKIELFDNYIFMLYRGIVDKEDGLEFEHLQISFFIGERILITRHLKNSLAIDSFFNKSGEKYLSRSPIHLAIKLFHYSCGLYLNELFNFELELGKIEDKFQHHGTDQMMRQITLYRSQLVKLRRTFNYHLNIGETLQTYIDNEDTDLITEKEVHTVIDLRERLDRLLSLSQMYYDICGDLINGYISITAHQLNDTMRILTVITAIFVPLGFLAGIYGMNFEFIPELKFHYGYFVLLAAMLLIAVSLITLFRKKRWL